MSTTLQAPPRPRAETATSQKATVVNPTRRGPILLACDGAGQSSAPVIAARLLADRLGLQLEVVTVLEPHVIYGVALGGPSTYLPEVDEARRANREDAVMNYIARFSGGATPVPMHVRFGAIAEEIATVARDRA